MSAGGPTSADKSLGEIVAEVSEKGSLLVREEIELAKAEILAKAKKMGRGAGIGVAAGVFLVFALVMFLHTLAWMLVEVFDLQIWVGFGIVTLLLVIMAAIAGMLAARWLKAGPPTPDMAIQEARITRDALEAQTVQRDQLERSLAGAKETAEETGKP
jgi:cobalamin biosynthesis protein CobD/CbiB